MGVSLNREAPRMHLDGALTAFLVGKRPALVDLPLWKRPLLGLMRFLYFLTGLSDVEFQYISTDFGRAEEDAHRPGWFYFELPVNCSLPEETCQFRRHSFASSKAGGRYVARALPMKAMKAMNRREVDLLLAQAQEVAQLAKSVNERLGG
ncbi:MAG TPA: hypothetical protein VK619_10355 [Pyrinomonadaceae bacterium]|nr:hypothetical protein [Pyrinomonadaceae bacterium]